MVVAASTAIFAIYWVGLIGGESLADRGVADPIITMWIPDIVFAGIGLALVSRMGRAGATVRGGGWSDIWLRLRGLLRPARRSSARVRSATA
jgi:lipopolysaccharide export system permease protein